MHQDNRHKSSALIKYDLSWGQKWSKFKQMHNFLFQRWRRLFIFTFWLKITEMIYIWRLILKTGEWERLCIILNQLRIRNVLLAPLQQQSRASHWCRIIVMTTETSIYISVHLYINRVSIFCPDCTVTLVYVE